MKVTERFVDIEGHRLACLAVNEHLAQPGEPAVVFIHGVLASVNFWRAALPADYRDNRPWYALSLPAHSPSTVPADFHPDQVDDDWFYRIMNGALEQLLQGRKAIVVGHSTGGFVALNLAIQHSPLLAGLVSIAGFHRGQWGGVEGLLVKLAAQGQWGRPLFAANIAIARHSRYVQKTFASLLARDRNAFLRHPMSQTMLDNIRADTRAQDARALYCLFNGISRLEIGHRLDAIRVPCHLFVGTHDPVVPASQSVLLADRVPSARTEVFWNVGHMPFMESTEQFGRALDRAITAITQQYKATAAAA
jgi:pimeloyl-ACP methyl ester carboxylesterase